MQLDWLLPSSVLAQVVEAAQGEPNGVATLVSHIFHVLAAVVAVGGMAYQRFVLLPASSVLPADAAAQLAAAARMQWSKWVAGSILFLLTSGLYSIMVIARTYDVPKYYHPLFGVKFLLAFLIFFISSLLAGRTAAAERFRLRAKFWLNVNLLAAVAVIVIAGVLSRAEKTPKIVEVAAPASVQPQ